MAEIRNLPEGTLRWVYASGSGRSWATASAPTSGLWGFITNFTYTSARDIQGVYDRGQPSHQKFVQNTIINGSFDIQWGVTADYPSVTQSGSGATVPMLHLEHRASAEEQGGGAAIWNQFHGVAILSDNWTETTPANTLTVNFQALGMNGPTASGYLSWSGS
jgi:hypothetical protein